MNESNVFARLILRRIKVDGARSAHDRDVAMLERTMASLRLDFKRLTNDRELAHLIADSVGRSRKWLLDVAAKRGFLPPQGRANVRAKAPKGTEQ